MTREDLIELAKLISLKMQRVSMLGMVNVWSQTPEQKVDLDAEYRVARDEWLAAERKYQDALDTYQRSNP